MTTLSIADRLHEDEAVVLLTELPRNVDGGLGQRRIQLVAVRRGEELCLFEKDLGPQFAFVNPGFRFPALECYSVGEALEIAERLREGRAPEEENPLDLIDAWARNLDERRQRRAHRSVSGPQFRKER